MTRLPRLSGRDAIRAFQKIGYEIDRQRGSHVILRKNESPFRRLVIPDRKELAIGTLRVAHP